MYDVRVGKWFSPDPLRQIYTSLSPFSFAANNPINITDADGNILKDLNGNIIATANERVDDEKHTRIVQSGNGSSLKIQYKYITIYTDEGNPVTAKMVTKAVVRMKGKDGKMTDRQAILKAWMLTQIAMDMHLQRVKLLLMMESLFKR